MTNKKNCKILRAREKIDMPILFFVDSEVFNYKKSKDFRHLTLFYTMYDRTEYYKNEMEENDE